jgi:gas vesicle protein
MYSQDNSSRALWFIAGAAVGAALALLFAPASGEVTRRRMRRAAEEGKDRISEAGRELVDKGKDIYEKGKHVAEDAATLFERGRKMVEG